MYTNLTNKKIKEIISLLFLIAIVIIPIFANADIVPCINDCGYEDLLKLINNIINWIILISVPVAAGVFAWAGFKLMTTGVIDEKAAAKEMLKKTLIGFVVILSAWIIVTTITDALLSKDFEGAIPIEGVK